MREYRMNTKIRKKRKKRVWRVRFCLIGMLIVIGILMIYIGISIATLICKTKEYKESNQIVQENQNRYEQMIDEVNATNQNDNIKEDVIKSEREIIIEKLEKFALEHDVSVQEYPEEMMELLEKNPETEEFVFNYPLKKDTYDTESLEEALNQTQIPLFLQWDSRWGYYMYGNKPMGMTGCGPTCLSMVALHLLQNPQMTPLYIADFSQRNGFYVENTGTAWSLMTQGAAELGLYAREVSLDEDLVMRYLAQGKPIICAMRRGDFTENGHFIVFVGVEDGKIRVNDPNSKIRSEKLWRFEDIKYQIKNMWVYSIR